MVRQWNSLSELCVTTRSTTSTPGLSRSHPVMVSPMVSRSRASVVENTFTPVKGTLAMRPPSYIQSGGASNDIEKLQRACPPGQAGSLFSAAWPDAVRVGAQRGPVGLLHATEDAVALPLPPLGPPLLGDLLRPLPRGLRPIDGHRAVTLAGIDNTPCPQGGGPMMLEAVFSMLPSRLCWALAALGAVSYTHLRA